MVVGAGVIGLTCAVTLAEAGYDTQVFARDLPLETSSAAGAGLWMPPLQGAGAESLRWAHTTWAALVAAAEHDDSGVAAMTGTLVHRASTTLAPSWSGRFASIAPLTEVSRPRPGYGSGWEVAVPLVDLSSYLPWLHRRLTAAGGSITRMPLSALPPRGIVINASGAAARWLADDDTVRPVRSQLVLMSNPGLTTWFVDADTDVDPLFVLPRGDRVVVGGTAEVDEWDTTPLQQHTESILARALQVEPRLLDASVLGQRVGLAPSRPRPRLELADGRDSNGRTLVHCYGHGTEGLTSSWGCAADVVALIEGIQPSLF